MATSITLKDIDIIAAHRDIIAQQMRDAIGLHAGTIAREIRLMETRRDEDPALWARFVVAKAILSPGTKLDLNIRLAVVLRDAIERGEDVRTYDDALPYIKAVGYHSRSAGQNVNCALAAYHALRNSQANSLTGLHVKGLSVKTHAWCNALNDANNRVYTLDTHMLRGIAHAAGIAGTSFSITNTAYPKLAELMLSIHDEVCGIQLPPLVSQWALWNEYRHPGIHASHLGIVA